MRVHQAGGYWDCYLKAYHSLQGYIKGCGKKTHAINECAAVAPPGDVNEAVAPPEDINECRKTLRRHYVGNIFSGMDQQRDCQCGVTVPSIDAILADRKTY